MACFIEVGGERGRHNDGSWYPLGEGLGDGLEFGLQKTAFYFLVQAGVGLDYVQMLSGIFGQLLIQIYCTDSFVISLEYGLTFPLAHIFIKKSCI